jgi:hypothetical protein
MVAYNFQARFAPDITSGKKCQTIRANGKRRHARPGETVQLYTGLRSHDCKLLRLGICLSVEPCHITSNDILLSGRPVQKLDDFAQADGFTDFAAMQAWFKEMHGLPFEGVLIKWILMGDLPPARREPHAL